MLGPATSEVLRLLPDLGRGSSRGRLPRRRRVGPTAPERRQARTLEGILGLLGPARRAAARSCCPRGPAPRRRRDPRARHVPGPDRPRRSGWRSSAPTSPTSSARDDPWAADLAAIAAAPRPTERLTLPPLDRDELAALIEGIEGERASASLLLLVAERSGGLPLVAEELLAARRELPSASLTGSFDELVIARLAVRSLECRRVLRLIVAGRPAAQPGAAGGVGRRVRGRDDPAGAALGRAARVTATACSTPTCWAGRAEALENGFLVETDGAIAFRHESIGRAVERDLLPIARTRYHAALATSLGGPPSAVAWHWLVGARPARRPAGRDRGGRRSPAPATPPRTSWPRSSWPCRSRRIRRPGSVRPWRRPAAPRTASTSRSGPRRRRSRSARSSRATAYLEVGHRRPRCPRAIASGSACSTSGWPTSGARPAIRPARCTRPAGRSSSCRASRAPERATVLAALAQLKMLDGIFSEAQRLAREAIKVARACDPVARSPGDPRHDDARRSRWRGAATRAPPIELLREAETGRPRARRSGCAVPDPRQPDDRPRPRRPADRGGRRRLRGHRGRPAGRARGRLRQLPGAATSPNRCSCSAAGPRRAR